MGEPKARAISANILAGLILAATCTACTHLQTNPTGEVPSVAPGQPASAGAQRGVSYQLPMVQYTVKITHSLESCPADAPPVFTVKVEAQERYVAGERFEVDYQTMSSAFKTTAFDMSLHDSGTLHTINARAQDQTGTVLTNVARIGLAVAGAAGGNPRALGVAETTSMDSQGNFVDRVETADTDAQRLALRCTAAARQKLADLAVETNKVTTLTGQVEALTARVTRLSAIAALEVMTDDDRTDLSSTVHTLLDTEAALRAANAQVATLQDDLNASEELTWPDQAGDVSAHSGTIALNDRTLRELFKLIEVEVTEGSQVSHLAIAERPDLERIPVTCRNDEQSTPAIDCLRELTRLNLALSATVTQAQSPARGNNGPLDDAVIPHADPRWARGIFIREPVDARLVVCRAPGLVVGMGCSDGRAPALRDDPVVAPQLGRLRLLPFRSRPFESNHLQLSMRANGFVEQFSYGEESSAVAATGAGADIAERNLAAQEARETERRSDIQYARDSRTYLRAEAAAARTEQLADLTHQVDMLKREGERLSAQAALEGMPASIQSGAEQARIDAEVKLLLSQIARLRAIADLAAAPQPPAPAP